FQDYAYAPFVKWTSSFLLNNQKRCTASLGGPTVEAWQFVRRPKNRLHCQSQLHFLPLVYSLCSISIRICPAEIYWPTSTSTSLTTPLTEIDRGTSIFMDSTTNSDCSACTASPAATSIEITLPVIGARNKTIPSTTSLFFLSVCARCIYQAADPSWIQSPD